MEQPVMHPKAPSTEPTPSGQSVEELVCAMHSSTEPPSIPDSPASTKVEPNSEGPSTPALPTLTEPSPNQDETPSTLSRRNSLRCELHGNNELEGFCITCGELICKECFWIDKSHRRHEIDSVQAVYQEQRVLTEQKVVQLDELAKSMQDDVQSILQMLNEQERSVYEQIDSVCAEEKQSVSRQLEERKRTLQMPLEFLNKKQKLDESLKLSPVEFLKQHSQVDKQLDEVLDKVDPHDFVPENFKDIGCELIPPFEMHTFQLDQFETADTWSQHMVTVCGSSWTVKLQKTDLFVSAKVTPPTKEYLNFPIELLVVIVHPDLNKNIRKTYTLQKTLEKIKIVAIDELKREGLIQNSALIVKIGLRPLNALVANHLLRQQNEIMKKNSQFCVMYFNVNENIKHLTQSSCLVDNAERQWCLAVYPFEGTAVGNNSGRKLQASIILCRGTGTKCRFFIELLHKDPEKNIRREAESLFEKEHDGRGSQRRTQKGWPCFVDQQRLLNDPGFCSEGILRFRFGVSPITE